MTATSTCIWIAKVNLMYECIQPTEVNNVFTCGALSVVSHL